MKTRMVWRCTRGHVVAKKHAYPDSVTGKWTIWCPHCQLQMTITRTKEAVK